LKNFRIQKLSHLDDISSGVSISCRQERLGILELSCSVVQQFRRLLTLFLGDAEFLCRTFLWRSLILFPAIFSAETMEITMESSLWTSSLSWLISLLRASLVFLHVKS
jgi:hypothetical protein